jgi:hypothetical protein
MSIKVDPFKMGEYFKCPLSRWWDISFKSNPQDYDGQKFYSLRTYLPDSCLDWDTAYKIRTKMEESLQLMYEHLPEQYSKYYAHTSKTIEGRIFKEKPFVSEFTLDLSDIPSVDNL